MKLLLQKSLEAVLTADLGTARTRPVAAEDQLDPRRQERAFEFSSRMGQINLLAQTEAASRRAERLQKRYAECEQDILLLLGRMIVRGRASQFAARALGEKLCGHKLRDHSVKEIQASLNREIDALNLREMARMRREESMSEDHTGYIVGRTGGAYPSSPIVNNTSFTNRIWNWESALAGS